MIKTAAICGDHWLQTKNGARLTTNTRVYLAYWAVQAVQPRFDVDADAGLPMSGSVSQSF